MRLLFSLLVLVVAATPASSLAAQAPRPADQPKKPRLPETTLEAFQPWIELGAPYDRPLVEESTRPAELSVTASDRTFWSFRPLASVALPEAKSLWPRNTLDRWKEIAFSVRPPTSHRSAWDGGGWTGPLMHILT